MSFRPDIPSQSRFKAPLAALRPAARDLARAFVDLGALHPRLRTFCDSIGSYEGLPALVLRPIAADALPPASGRVTIRIPYGDIPFSLSAPRILAVGPDTAIVPLYGTHIEPLTQRSAPRANSLPLAAIIPACTDDVGLHAFPVADIGAAWCAIETSFGINPGTELDVIQIVSGQHTLRSCAGTVVETVPWRLPHGERIFRCRIAFGAGVTRGKQHDIVSVPEKLHGILRYASLLKVPVVCRILGREAMEAHVIHVESASLRLLLHALPAAMPQKGQMVRLTFELFTESFEADVRMLNAAGSSATVTMPLTLRRRHRRQEQRTDVPTRGLVSLRFTNPTSGESCVRHVLDLSFGGLCFATDESDVLWPELSLSDAKLEWNGRRIEIDQTVIRGVGGGRAHVAFARQDTSGDIDMIDLVAALRHPALERDDGTRYAEMVELQHAVHALTPYSQRTLPNAAEAAEVWQRMHESATDVARTLVCREDDKVVAAVTAVRAWERAWFPGSMAALPGRRWRTPAGLDLAYTDHIVLRPDAYYSVMAVKVGNVRQTEFLGGFLEQEGTAEVGLRRTIQMWGLGMGNERAVTARDGYKVRRMRPEQEELVSRAAMRVYSEIHASALSMLPGEMTLPDTRRRFREARIDRHRDCFIVSRRGIPQLAMLCEHASPGVHFNYFFSATWIIPIHADTASNRDAWQTALEHVTRTRPPVASEDSLVIVPEGTAPEAFLDAGFSHQFSLHLYAYNRAGTQRWYDYVHELRGDWLASKEAKVTDGTESVRHRRAS